jgi:hypothetical protein
LVAGCGDQVGEGQCSHAVLVGLSAWLEDDVR